MPRRTHHRRMALRTALMLSAGAMLVAVLVAFVVPLSVSMAHHNLDEARAQELADGTRLASRVSDAVAAATIVPSEPSPPGVTIANEVERIARPAGLRVLVVDTTRRVLYDSAGTNPFGSVAADPNGAFARAMVKGRRFTTDSAARQDGQLVLTLPVFEAGAVVGAVRVERPVASVEAANRRVDLELTGFAFLALLVGLVVAGYLSQLVTRPVRRLEEAARQLGAGDLDARAPEARGRELTSLAESFNSMAAEIGANIRAQQDFAANASHQLRTPLTALQLRLEAIAGESDVDAAAEARHALDDVSRLIGLMQDLLALARVSAPVHGGEPVDLGELATTVVERWSETANRQGKDLTLSINDPAVVIADPHDLEDLLDNLLDNAIRYSGDATNVDVAVQGTTLSTQNGGPPIPPDERTQIFERFYRGSQGRSASAGTGLGLAIVEALAHRWGARVVLADAPGTRFEVRFATQVAAR